MSTRLKLSTLALLAFATLATPVQAETVVAIVNGHKILKEDVMDVMKTLPVEGADQDAIFPIVVNQMINEQLVDDATAKSEIEKTPDFQKRLNVLRSSLVKQMYIEKFMKDKVTDSKVKEEYKKFKSENAGKTEVHAKHILVPTEAEAKQIIKELGSGAKFEDLAKQRSSGPTAQMGGDVGYFVKEDMVPEFSKAAFSITPKSYGKTPVKTEFGWHVIKVEDKRTREVPDLKEIEGAIRNKLGQEALQELVTSLRAKADIQQFDMDGKPLKGAKAQ